MSNVSVSFEARAEGLVLRVVMDADVVRALAGQGSWRQVLEEFVNVPEALTGTSRLDPQLVRMEIDVAPDEVEA